MGHLARRRRSPRPDRKSTRLNSSHSQISYAVFCLKKKTGRSVILATTNAVHHLSWNIQGLPLLPEQASSLFPASSVCAVVSISPFSFRLLTRECRDHCGRVRTANSLPHRYQFALPHRATEPAWRGGDFQERRRRQ